MAFDTDKRPGGRYNQKRNHVDKTFCAAAERWRIRAFPSGEILPRNQKALAAAFDAHGEISGHVPVACFVILDCSTPLRSRLHLCRSAIRPCKPECFSLTSKFKNRRDRCEGKKRYHSPSR